MQPTLPPPADYEITEPVPRARAWHRHLFAAYVAGTLIGLVIGFSLARLG